MFKKILIVGCGLIGSSILRAIIEKKISKKIYILEKSKKNISKIKKINSNLIFLNKINKNISKIDFVILCTPMSEYEKIILKLNNFLPSNGLITDVGSTKKTLLEIKNKKLNKRLNWIMSHPISGSEVSGPEYGSKNLFKKKWCIIIRDKNKKAEIQVVKFWKKIGAKIVFMQSEEHDKIFSITSHLPHLIAYNLIKTAQDFQKKNKKNIVKFSAGGLRDFSRTAASNEIMWRDIFFSNKINMIKVIDMFIKNLNGLKKNIKLSEDKKLQRILKNSKKVRKQIIDLKQDVSKPDFGRTSI
ncbi:MAG: prephenate dehydrogenase/arogenate dehydrogenase family protein [Flavobacteriales bacterium TMED235]|nr:MAG: prephenate dehydrogenase/arogenate dehydrogenase family protein [Flavobacteriales bacterium TMED235]